MLIRAQGPVPGGPLRRNQGKLTCSEGVSPCPRHSLQERVWGLERDTVSREDQACGTRAGGVCWTRAWALRPGVALAGGSPLHYEGNPLSVRPHSTYQEAPSTTPAPRKGLFWGSRRASQLLSGQGGIPAPPTALTPGLSHHLWAQASHPPPQGTGPAGSGHENGPGA